MKDVPRIMENRGELILQREQIRALVELPAVKACEHLYDLNIQTIYANANCEYFEGDNEPCRAWVTIDAGSLSEENQEIAKNESFWREGSEGTFVEISVPFDKDTPVEEVENHLLEQAKKFKPQEFTWAPRWTAVELIKSFRKMYYLIEDKYNDEKVWKFINDQVQEGRYYYDSDSGIYFKSQEHAYKYKTSKQEHE